MAKISFNARIEKGENGWYVGQIEEMPEVISQGKTIEELNENLMDAFRLIVDQRRESIALASQGRNTIRRKISFAG
ncbi:MAG TPA: type II toxin-antitoxin system HicB family antitoxin [Prolixibacteraceae bacterium]|nr:type II toxin-antitoxin system HicB family antitoxin [Prolixibacteraceae bacterium]HPS13004.1 type II toxin-antitoxin system HicB family antitoxin [Prolixibacteraceae bacterium]